MKGLVVVLLLGVPATAALAQGRPITGNGTEALRAILKQAGYTPYHPQKDALKPLGSPPTTLLVVIGHDAEMFSAEELARFVGTGGAILLASDLPSHHEWFRAFGVTVTGGRVTATAQWTRYRPLDPDPRYQACPVMRPTEDEALATELFGEPPRPLVVTDGPSRLELDPRSPLNVLARLPASCRISDARPDPAGAAVVAGQSFHRFGGRLLVVADQSVFVNRLMVPAVPDTGNFAFAVNTVAWLSNTHQDKPRNRCVFIENGTMVSDFHVELQNVPMPPVPPSLNLDRLAWNELAHGLQRENVLNQMLLSVLPTNRMVRILLGVGTVALLVLVLRAILRARTSSFGGAIASTGVSDPYEQRDRELAQTHPRKALA